MIDRTQTDGMYTALNSTLATLMEERGWKIVVYKMPNRQRKWWEQNANLDRYGVVFMWGGDYSFIETTTLKEAAFVSRQLVDLQ